MAHVTRGDARRSYLHEAAIDLADIARDQREIKVIAARLAERAGRQAEAAQDAYCRRAGCSSSYCGSRAYADAAHDEHDFVLRLSLDDARRRAAAHDAERAP